MQFKTIGFDVSNHLATLTLNRPDKLNALSIELLIEMAGSEPASRASSDLIRN